MKRGREFETSGNTASKPRLSRKLCLETTVFRLFFWRFGEVLCCYLSVVFPRCWRVVWWQGMAPPRECGKLRIITVPALTRLGSRGRRALLSIWRSSTTGYRSLPLSGCSEKLRWGKHHGYVVLVVLLHLECLWLIEACVCFLCRLRASWFKSTPKRVMQSLTLLVERCTASTNIFNAFAGVVVILWKLVSNWHDICDKGFTFSHVKLWRVECGVMM